MNLSALVMIVAAYLIGSVSFAVIIPKLMALDDPRTYGSGNPGATNVLRGGNKTAAALTLAGDLFKGFLPVALALFLHRPWSWHSAVVGLTAIAVVAGHMYPLFFDFKGGKGVATAAGALLALSPFTALICIALWLVLALGAKISSVASVAAAVAAPVAGFFLARDYWQFAAIVIMTVLVLYRHKGNIQRLRNGTESKIGDKS